MARLLSEALSVPLTSTGAMQREIAARRGMSTLELNRQAENEVSLDHQIDAVTREIGIRNSPYVVDSRMAWKFIPNALKVFLTVDEVVGAERVISVARVAESHTEGVRGAIEANRARRSSEVKRFSQLYTVDPTNWDNFDLVINTTVLTPDEVCAAILNFNQTWPPRSGVRYLNSPRGCFPVETDARRALARLSAGVVLTSDHVDVVHVDGVDLIWSGLEVVAARILAGVATVEARVVAKGMDAALPNNLPVSGFLRLLPALSALYDWEDALKFKFYRYPDWFVSAGDRSRMQ